MAVRLSRRKIASYYADELLAGRTDVARQLAGYLLQSRRMRELPLIVRDIEAALAARGVVVADVASARELDNETRREIEAYVQNHSEAKSVQLRTHVDENLLGGVRLNVPGSELDATLRHKLAILKAHKL